MKDFHVWQDLFTATMTALDVQWTMILKDIEDMDEEIIKKEQEEEMRKRWGVSSEAVWKKIKQILYLNLLQYTTGEPNTKVKGLGAEGVLEAYRHLTHKGQECNFTCTHGPTDEVHEPECGKEYVGD